MFAHLSFQKLETRTTASAHMTELIFVTILGYNGSSVTSTDDDRGTFLNGLDCCIEEGLGTFRELGEFKDPGRPRFLFLFSKSTIRIA